MSQSAQRGYVLKLIDRKLSGQQRLDARTFVMESARTGQSVSRLFNRLKELPDLEPEVAKSLHTRLDHPVERNKTIPDAVRELLCADRATGMTHAGIAEKHGIPQGTVYSITRWVKASPKGLTADQQEQMRADRAMGLTHDALIAKYDVSRWTVRRVVHDVEVKPQPGYSQPAIPKERTAPMATRQKDSVALAKRCEDVGWETQNTPKGIRVKNPDGKIKIIHLSFSDINALEACERDLNRLGLADAEERLRTERSGGRLRALEADRQKNAARTEQLTAAQKKQQRELVLKAAGPYLVEPEDVPLEWFTKEHPAPWMRWVWMTPAIASYLLDHHNKPGGAGKIGTNRSQSEAQIRHYRDIYLAGQWRLTHQGMASDTNSMVQDGQHRQAGLLAAAELDPNIKVPVAYFVGMDPENFKAIDEGLVRTASQLFAMGGEKNGGTLRSALRLIIAFKEGDEGARNRLRLRNTNAQLLDAFARNPEVLRNAATMSTSSSAKVPMSGGAFTALHYLLYTANGADNRFVDAFLHGIAHGTKMGTRMLLDDDDPRAALRRTLAAFKAKQDGRSAQAVDQLGLAIMSWNFMVMGRHRQNLRWPKGTEIPQVLICKDGVGAIPPRALTGEVDIIVADTEEDSDG